MPEYSVRLVLRVAADSPDKAAPTFITHLVENGMTDWVYQVCDPETAEILGYFDGFGLPVNVDELGPAPQVDNEPEHIEEQTPVQTGESDAQLLTLAQQLNEEDAASVSEPDAGPTEQTAPE